jgi:virginiamycin B lyase
MSASASHAALISPSPVREVTIQRGAALVPSVQTPRVVGASAIVTGSGTNPFRPVDASLLEAIAVSKRGDIWIAAIRNGAQTSGTSERIVVFDPHTSRMSAFKLGRGTEGAAEIVPSTDGGVWSAQGPFVRREFANGSAQVYVAPSTEDVVQALEVDSSGDPIAFEPHASALGHVDAASGSWTNVRLRPAVQSVMASALDDSGDVFYSDNASGIIRRSSSGVVNRFSIAPLGASAIAINPTGDVWFRDDQDDFGLISNAGEATSVWHTHGYLKSVIAGARGHAWLLGEELSSFDARTSTATVIESRVGYAYGIAPDGDGGVWLSDSSGLTHVDSGGTRAVKYAIPQIGELTPVGARADRVCFTGSFRVNVDDQFAQGGVACLTPSLDVITAFTDRFSPGISGIVADGSDMWLVERGRATRVDAADSIRRYLYATLPIGPANAAISSDHSIWLAGAGLLERFYGSGPSQRYRVTYPGNGPFGLAPDDHGGTVFTVGHGVGDISVDSNGAEHLRFYETGPSSSPEGVVAASDGTIWCTDTGGWLLRVTIEGAVKRYRVPTSPSEPYGIALGPDGVIWFTEFFGAKVGRLDPKTGNIREFQIPYAQSFPTGITAGAHDMWFLDLNNNVGRVTMAGKITEYPVLAQSPVAY